MQFRLVAMVSAVAGLLLLPMGVAAQGADPLSVVSASIAALNAGDAAGATALFAADATVTIRPGRPGRPETSTGTAQILALWQTGVAQHIHIDMVGTPQVAGDTVTGTISVAADDLRQLGITSVQRTLVSVVRGGKIASLTLTLTPDSAAKLQAALAKAARVAQIPRSGAASGPAQNPARMPSTGDGGGVGPGGDVVLLGLLLVAFGTRRLVTRNAAAA